ncbi:methionine ABC transporter ATP-binding protein, partial [Ralstonia pseudosolanacearum]
LALPGGCAFRERCAFASDICKQAPALERLDDGRALRCFHPVTQRPEETAA